MKIKFLNGKDSGREFEINSQSVSIGRDPANLISFDTDGVSRCHAEMKQLPSGEWMLYDLNSTNGVKVNNKKIDSFSPVSEGDIIGIGENSFCISALQTEPARVIFNPIVSAPVTDPEEPAKPANAPEITPEVNFFTSGSKAAVPGTAVDAAEHSASANSGSNVSNIASELHNFSGSLFSKKKNVSGDEKDGSAAADPKKRRSNMIFYTVLVCVVIMILSSAFSIMSPEKKTRKRNAAPQNLVVRYEKEVFQKDNVFRFEFYLRSKIVKAAPEDENGTEKNKRVYTVRFTIDDVNSKRHYTKETAVADDTVEQLRLAIRSSGIYATTPADAPRDNTHNRTLLIAEGRRILTVKIPGEYAPQEFNTIEETINDIADNFGLKTIAMTPEELLSQANDYFLKAEDLFTNRAKTGNLRDAIIRYRAVVESLEQFSPKPKMWDRARKQLEQAIKERDAKLEMFNAEYKRLSQMREFAPMREVFLNIMELTEPDSREYARAKRRLVIIDQALRKTKRK